MPSAEALVATERPGRYLAQLCKHFSSRGRHLGHRPRAHGDAEALEVMRAVAEQAEVTWSETEGEVRLPWGRCTMRVERGGLALRVEAEEEGSLGRLQGLLAGHVERFGRREGLRVSWGAGAVDAPSQGRRPRFGVVGLVAVVALAVAVHLGLGGVVLANWQWSVGGVLVVVAAKAVLLGGGFAVHRRGRISRSG